jgi:hypothetical protein
MSANITRSTDLDIPGSFSSLPPGSLLFATRLLLIRSRGSQQRHGCVDQCNGAPPCMGRAADSAPRILRADHGCVFVRSGNSVLQNLWRALTVTGTFQGGVTVYPGAVLVPSLGFPVISLPRSVFRCATLTSRTRTFVDFSFLLPASTYLLSVRAYNAKACFIVAILLYLDIMTS